MGNCWSAKIKAESPFNSASASGVNSRDNSKDGNGLCGSSSWVSLYSVPLTPLSEDKILQSLKLSCFAFTDLKTATRNFRPDRLLGVGGFASVFKGWIDEHALTASKPGAGMVIAVKRLNHDGFQGQREWLAEVKHLDQFHHPNLVRLIGFCLEDDHRLLVYEFTSRGSLANHLYNKKSDFQPLPWNLRMKVALGAAKGLAYLHNRAETRVICPDFKTSDVLLDSNYNAKLSSDFALAKDGHTRVTGNYVYAAPEYLATGHLTAKSDVYRIGVLEILSGQRALDKSRPTGKCNLVEWARPYLTDKRKIFRVLDSRLGGQHSVVAAQKVAALAFHCLSTEAELRPTMDEVVSTLEQLQDSKGRGKTISL